MTTPKNSVDEVNTPTEVRTPFPPQPRIKEEREQKRKTPVSTVSASAIEPSIIIKNFLASANEKLELQVSLTTKERQEFHKLAQFYGLQHVSSGDDDLRILTISKPGVILGKCSLKKQISSDLIKHAVASSTIPSSSEVGAVLRDDLQQEEHCERRTQAQVWPPSWLEK